MKTLFFTIVLILHSFWLFPQGAFQSENGEFTSNYLKGCVGTTITITPSNAAGTLFACFNADLTDIGANNPCFNTQELEAEPLSFTYTTAGLYDILFLRQLGNSQVYDSLTVEIIEPSSPSITLSNCSAGLVFNLNPQIEDYDTYAVDFGDGNNAEYSISAFPFTYNYANPSQEYTVTVTGSFNNTGNNNCTNNVFSETFVPQEQQEEAAEIEALTLLSESSFEISYSLNPTQIYQLQVKQNAGGVYQTVQTFSGSAGGVFTFTDLNLSENFYCVRIVTTSECDGTDLISNEACTILFEGQANQTGNLLNWNHFNFQNSQLLKNGQIIHEGDAPFQDLTVLCGQADSYQVIGTDGNGLVVNSLPLELTAIAGTPTIPITQIATNVLSDSELELTWEVPVGLQPASFIIYKKRSLSEQFFELATTQSNTFIDEGGSFFSRNFYYSVSYTNNCGGISPVTTTAPNILLKVSQRGTTLDLGWNSYSGFDSLFDQFIIRKYDQNMNLLFSQELESSTSFSENIAQSDQQLIQYQIEAYSRNGLIAYSNLIQYKIPPTFFVPTAFSPNGDSRNEELKVFGKFIDQVDFSIYNRWGTLIFRSTDINEGWDGFLPSREAEAGTYTYSIRVTDSFGEEYYKSGVFNLIR